MYFALPHVNITSLVSTTTIDLNISLNNYIKNVEHILIDTAIPHSFEYISNELMHYFNLKIDNSIYLEKVEPLKTYSLIFYEGDLQETIMNYQTIGGNCILKIKDSTHSDTINFLYLLSACYETVYLCKPEVDPLSSIKYAVCCNFKKKCVLSEYKIPYYFIMKLDDINSIFGNFQLEHICSKINTQ